MSGLHSADRDFSPSAFWAERLCALPSLMATGTRPFNETYQRYLYLLKERALQRALRPWRKSIRGASVLNAGCGWGFFEPVFDRWGAVEIAGIDFVEDTVRALQSARPGYEYHAADLTVALPESIRGRTFNVVTAIDVLYHIVEEERFANALENLCAAVRPQGGLLVWTDAPARRDEKHQPHCRYRSTEQYEAVLGRFGLVVRRCVPMYMLFDVYHRWSERLAQHPNVFYPAMYVIDRAFARFGWRAGANWIFVAVREEPA